MAYMGRIQLFSGANSILYGKYYVYFLISCQYRTSTDDSPERKFDTYDREGLATSTLEDAEGTSNLSENEAIPNPSNPTETLKLSRTPRREVWWLDPPGAINQSLESIKRCFKDRLDRFLLSSSNSNSLLRHIRSPTDNNLRRNLHQCRGYLREEITLTSDVSRSAIVSHAFPSQSELCSVCGQLVQYTYYEPSIADKEIGSPDSDENHRKTLAEKLLPKRSGVEQLSFSLYLVES